MNDIVRFTSFAATEFVSSWALPWLNYLTNSWLAHPSWGTAVIYPAAVTGIVVALVFFFFGRTWPVRQVRRVITIWFAVFVASLVTCMILASTIDYWSSQANAVYARTVWRAVFMLLCVALLVVLGLLSLFLKKSPPATGPTS